MILPFVMRKESSQPRALEELRAELAALALRSAAALAEITQLQRRIQELSRRLASEDWSDRPSAEDR